MLKVQLCLTFQHLCYFRLLDRILNSEETSKIDFFPDKNTLYEMIKLYHKKNFKFSFRLVQKIFFFAKKILSRSN